jgi:hypothetical protein
MQIDISTEVLKKLCVTPTEYVYLYLVFLQEYEELESLNLNVSVEDLQTKGLIKIGAEGIKSHVVRYGFQHVQETSFDQMWFELLSHFPLKVSTRGGGIRVLRAKDPEVQSNQKAKSRYQKYVGKSLAKHTEVIKGLQNELDIRRKSNQMEFMQNLDTWLNQHTWEKYISIDAGEHEQSQSGHRITRKL